MHQYTVYYEYCWLCDRLLLFCLDKSNCYMHLCKNATNVVSYHLSFIGVIESLQQLNAGALPTAAASHKSKSLSWMYRHLQTPQNLDVWPAGIREPTPFEFYLALEVIL